MTTSDQSPDQPPAAGGAEAASEHDPEAAEEYAESVPIDPSTDQIDHYLEMIGDPEASGGRSAEPPGEDTAP